MKRWQYDNEQWTQAPIYVRHLPLFTRHYDLMSLCIRATWSVFLKFIFFRFYIRLKVIGNFSEIYQNHYLALKFF